MDAPIAAPVAGGIPATAEDLQSKVERVVVAGLKLMYDPKMRKMLVDGTTAKTPLPQKLAMETAGIMKLLKDKAPNGIPPEVVSPAAVMIMFEFALFMKQAGMGTPSPQEMQAAMKILQQLLITVFAPRGAPPAASAPAAPVPAPAPAAPAQGGLIQQPGA